MGSWGGVASILLLIFQIVGPYTSASFMRHVSESKFKTLVFFFFYISVINMEKEPKSTFLMMIAAKVAVLSFIL